MPRELPTDLDELRDHSDIMEDVWTTHSPLPVPKWFSSAEVRKGIRAMLKLDRCQEEVHRLGIEADNLCRWYGRQLADIEFALTQPAGQSVALELVIYRDHLYSLKASWANTFASTVRFDAQIAASKVVAPVDHPAPLRWITPTVSAFEPATQHDPLPPPDHEPALDTTPILDDEEIYGGYEPPRKVSKPKFTYLWASPPGILRDDDVFDLLGSLPASIPDTEHCIRQTGARIGVRKGLIEEILTFVNHLVHAAEIHQHRIGLGAGEHWEINPASTRELQEDSISGGLWVLAQIAAILRGFHTTQLAQVHLPAFRAFVYHHMLLIPRKPM
ncbi:hypothetical protein CC1G_14732 [Coprinopsis cinerea okayama7|uniref:Uncharacterized protein n=1 Tax=Coprinopsis cinerea (strain Okayama-7 / 130 / ATCC MYA-4618 / FGSC 9003) TaxID=240176 RepID=D6RMM3_COPC7|nr:hypothetical protein CC1G_14732 [Coprinopsis cinerea okayama7\|eukprot:XP_002911303.1 hypothetical protein CC1G_14732 [Coprinopsis cinerea okayama7\